jgi:hypothetical protein
LAFYADDTAIIATSRQPTLLVNYLESYFSGLVWWLRKLRIDIIIPKSAAMLFAKAASRIPTL